MESYGPELNRIRCLLKGTTKGLTVTEISRSIEINRNSVAKYLDVLLSQGQVEMKVVGSAKVFSLTKRIPISSILSLSSDYIIVLDEDFIVTYVNDNVVHFEKTAFDEIVGKPLDDLPVPFFIVPDIRTLLKSGISGKEILEEVEVKNEDKTYFFRVKFVPSILENRKKGLLIILYDITEIRQYQHHLENTVAKRDSELTTTYKNLDEEIKSHQVIKEAYTESERKYSKLIELAQEGVWTFDTEGMTTFVNKKCSEILGYSEEEMAGTSIFSYTDAGHKTLLESFFSGLKSGRTGCFEVVFFRKDEKPVFTRVSASPCMDEQGAFSYGLFLVSDISELKKVDEALREREIHYRTLIETCPYGIIVIDSDGRIQDANIQTTKMLGYKKPVDLIGNNLFDYVTPDDLEKVHSTLQYASDNAKVKNTECTLISNENHAFCADLNMSILLHTAKTPSAHVCIIMDITERRKAESLVRKSEEKHRALVEGISHIIFTTDTKGKFTYISPVIHKVLGYTPEELIGMHFYTLIPSDERQRFGLKLKNAKSGKFSPSDFKMIDKAGNVRWVRIMAQPLREDNRLTGITGLIGDITDWKQKEDALERVEMQYKAVVEDQTDLICRFSTDHAITFANPAFCRFYHKNLEEILTRDFLSFIPLKYLEMVRKILDEVSLDRPVQSLDLEIAPYNLDSRWYHLSIRAIFNTQGEKVEYQSSSHDITELKAYFEKSHALLQELQVKNIELERQAEELRIAHLANEELRDKYYNLYDLAPLCHLILTDDGRITEVNHAGAMLFGTERNKLIHHEFKAFISHDFIKQWKEFFLQVRKQENKLTCSLMLLKLDGSVFPARIDGIRISDSSGASTTRIIIRDITDIKMAEEAMREINEQFRNVVEQSPQISVVVDKNGIITLSEGMGLARLGFGPGEVVGLSVFDVFADTPAICEAGRKALSGEQQKFNVEVGSGTFEIFFNPLRDKSGEVTSFIGVASDITDRIASEETIRNASKKLNMLHKLTRHTMINKMTVLCGYLSILDANLPESSPLRKSLEPLKIAADEINRLIIFSRTFQTLGVNPPKWHNLKKIVEKSIATVKPRNVNLDISLDSVEVFSDPLIENVFCNLLDNSLRHGKNVTDIRINFGEKNGNGIIEYTDNGVGLSGSVKDNLFTPDSGMNAEFGLFLSKEILDYTGISFQENGEENKGARFEIIVPKSMFRMTD